ncbi:hypothetical protein BH20BAC1_BH20BAC1_28400 [soil metagenome]
MNNKKSKIMGIIKSPKESFGHINHGSDNAKKKPNC